MVYLCEVCWGLPQDICSWLQPFCELLSCICVHVNGPHTMAVSLTLVFLYASVLDTWRFLCISVPEQTGIFPGDSTFPFQCWVHLRVSDKTSDSFMTASTAGSPSLPYTGSFYFQANMLHLECFYLFPTFSTYFQVLFLNMGMMCQEEPKKLNDLEKQSL